MSHPAISTEPATSADFTRQPEKIFAQAESSGQANRQPAPRFPNVTKKMVRQHTDRLVKEGVWKHRPATQQEWLLAEFELARQITPSILRLAIHVSEALGDRPIKTAPTARG